MARYHVSFPNSRDCESIKQHNAPQSHSVQNYQKLSEKTPKTQKQGKKSPVFKHIEHFLTHFLNAGHNNPVVYQTLGC
jgi:hypothetical protein